MRTQVMHTQAATHLPKGHATKNLGLVLLCQLQLLVQLCKLTLLVLDLLFLHCQLLSHQRVELPRQHHRCRVPTIVCDAHERQRAEQLPHHKSTAFPPPPPSHLRLHCLNRIHTGAGFLEQRLQLASVSTKLAHCGLLLLTLLCLSITATITGASVYASRTYMPEDFRRNMHFKEQVQREFLAYFLALTQSQPALSLLTRVNMFWCRC